MDAVYLDQQMGAMHAVPQSKSTFSITNRKKLKKKCKKKLENTGNQGLQVIRFYSKTPADTQKLVNSCGKYNLTVIKYNVTSR